MTGAKLLPVPVDLPVGGHVWRETGLIWRRRPDWTASDYAFISEQYRKLARAHEEVAAAVDAERKSRFRNQE